ncbi:MAG: hypothetical protein KA981_04175 [Bacteroidia bacterium]|nr:hypothetical protein [Bacteroidia bacterium]
MRVSVFLFFCFFSFNLFGQLAIKPYIIGSASYSQEKYTLVKSPLPYFTYPTISSYFSALLGFGVELNDKFIIESSIGYSKISYNLFQTLDVIKYDYIQLQLDGKYIFFSNKKINPTLGLGSAAFINFGSTNYPPTNFESRIYSGIINAGIRYKFERTSIGFNKNFYLPINYNYMDISYYSNSTISFKYFLK